MRCQESLTSLIKYLSYLPIFEPREFVSRGAPTESATQFRTACQWHPDTCICSQTSVAMGRDCHSALTSTSPSAQPPQDYGPLRQPVAHHQVHVPSDMRRRSRPPSHG